MRSRLTRVGSCLEKRHVFLLWIAERKPSIRAALVCLSCFVAWGFGFCCRTGLWARPRPGALGGALAMLRKIWSGPMLHPPKFPGVAMESSLSLAPPPGHPAAGRCVRVVPVLPLLLCTRPARARPSIGGQSPTHAPRQRQLPWSPPRGPERTVRFYPRLSVVAH
jgi:hypothetical protein